MSVLDDALQQEGDSETPTDRLRILTMKACVGELVGSMRGIESICSHKQGS
jgi:hypothetical protein